MFEKITVRIVYSPIFPYQMVLENHQKNTREKVKNKQRSKIKNTREKVPKGVNLKYIEKMEENWRSFFYISLKICRSIIFTKDYSYLT